MTVVEIVSLHLSTTCPPKPYLSLISLHSFSTTSTINYSSLHPTSISFNPHFCWLSSQLLQLLSNPIFIFHASCPPILALITWYSIGTLWLNPFHHPYYWLSFSNLTLYFLSITSPQYCFLYYSFHFYLLTINQFLQLYLISLNILYKVLTQSPVFFHRFVINKEKKKHLVHTVKWMVNQAEIMQS